LVSEVFFVFSFGLFMDKVVEDFGVWTGVNL
jgi:hypothetical protein